MKILSCTQQKEADAYTIAHESILSINLMEKAAGLLAQAISERYDKSHRLVVFAGPGNNGGDALAVARILFLKNYPVEVYLFNVKGTLSEECLTNVQRLKESGFANYTEVSNQFDPPHLGSHDVVIDGLFGSGLQKPLSGGFAAVVQYINASPAQVVSIDIPSGLMGEDNTHNIRQNIIKADLTLSIQLPKLSFLFAENADVVGEWQLLDIGISREFIEAAKTPYYITEASEMRALIKPRKKFAHKGMFGHGLLIAGSYGMGGAALLASRACLRSGIGLLTVHTPVCNHDLLQSNVPEAMVQDDVHDRCFAEAADLDNFQAVAIGPGLGQEEITVQALFDQVSNCYIPLVLDADALNIFSNYRNYLTRIPRHSILTPHVKELERIIGRCSNSYERLSKAKELAAHLQCYIVLKGAWSAVITPDEKIGVYVLPIHHCMFKKPGVDTASLKEVASHPQALRQTVHTRKAKFPNLAEHEIEDTAIGAEMLAKGTLPETTAAICSARAGKLWNLEMIAENIEDSSENRTTFWLLKLA